MTFKEKLDKAYLTIGIIFATIIIIPVETFLLFPVTAQTFSSLSEDYSKIFPPGSYILTAYLMIPIIYCIFATLFFKPKRLISPLNVQIGTYILYSALIIYNTFSLNMNPEFYTDLVLGLVFVGFVILGIGMFQFFVVRWVVGLNYDSSDRITYHVNMKPQDVANILGKNFKRTWKFTYRKEESENEKPAWYLKIKDTFSNYVLVGIGSMVEEPEKCIIATVAFQSDRIVWVQKSKTATEERESIINDIIGRLKKVNPQVTLEKINETSDEISVMTFAYVDSITRSKIGIFRDIFRIIPRNFKIAIGITITTLIVLSAACYFGFIDSNTYVGVMIPTLLALIFEFGIPLKDEFKKKKKYEFG
jgi:hypothetical protein